MCLCIVHSMEDLVNSSTKLHEGFFIFVIVYYHETPIIKFATQELVLQHHACSKL